MSAHHHHCMKTATSPQPGVHGNPPNTTTMSDHPTQQCPPPPLHNKNKEPRHPATTPNDHLPPLLLNTSNEHPPPPPLRENGNEPTTRHAWQPTQHNDNERPPHPMTATLSQTTEDRFSVYNEMAGIPPTLLFFPFRSKDGGPLFSCHVADSNMATKQRMMTIFVVIHPHRYMA